MARTSHQLRDAHCGGLAGRLSALGCRREPESSSFAALTFDARAWMKQAPEPKCVRCAIAVVERDARVPKGSRLASLFPFVALARGTWTCSRRRVPSLERARRVAFCGRENPGLRGAPRCLGREAALTLLCL
eukprot:Amastigsp_a842660_8.p2 type:complete len:132 gc:universal Amastigsp_a842660_8:162-557(+)